MPMNRTEIEAAGNALAQARRSGVLLDALPFRPHSIAEAHAIQDASLAALGEPVRGWKVGFAEDGGVMRGALLGPRLLASPARLRAAEVPMLGLEAEIAFRFEQDLPAREPPYTAGEVADAVTALVGIEVVDTRFKSYDATPLLDRLADCVSNGAYVTGTARRDWRDFDLSALKAILTINGRVVVEQVGGHAARDPILPAIALVNALRTGAGVATGQIMTTGTYTGLTIAQPGDNVVASFEGFGSAELVLER